jgi:hypothetical protein
MPTTVSRLARSRVPTRSHRAYASGYTLALSCNMLHGMLSFGIRCRGVVADVIASC